MGKPRILIVDDEVNIRFTITEALASLPVEIDVASDGRQALDKVEQGAFSVILLDLRMPGMDGMETLERLRQSRPEIPVVILTAHGTIESAVDAMKLGAIDFLKKPFVPDDVRQLVNRILERRELEAGVHADYKTCFESAKRCLSERQVEAATAHLRQAISINPRRPEAYNLLGAIQELRGETSEALNNYRAALSFDPAYEPPRLNIDRATSSHPRRDPITFGELRDEPGDDR